MSQDQVGECSCESCLRACRTRPGFFKAEQIEPLARQLGLSLEELIQQHLQFDFWAGGGLEVNMLVPRVEGQEGGSAVPWWPIGTCHWFVDGRCQIHELGKPAECQGLGHIDGVDVQADRESIAKSWVEKQDWVQSLREKFPERTGLWADTEERIRQRIEAMLPPDVRAEYARLLGIGKDGHRAWCRINHVGDHCNCGVEKGVST